MGTSGGLNGASCVHFAPFGWMPWSGSGDYLFQLMRLLEAAQGGAGFIAECLMTAGKIIPGNDESWYSEWKKIAEVNKARGDIARASGDIISAQANWLCASSYFRTAEAFLKFEDSRRKLLLKQMRASSRLYLKNTNPPGEVVKIENFDGGVIEGYFLRASGATSSTPVVLCIGGPDHFKDEHLWRLRPHAIDRNLSLLLIDLHEPDTLERKRMARRHDATMSIRSCVDYLINRADVDEDRIAIYGEGSGASLATEAALQDSRFSAAVCDGGMLDSLQRAFSFQQFFGTGDSLSIERGIKKLTRNCLARRIGCPVLIVTAESDGLDAARTADLHKSMQVASSNVSLKIFPRREVAVVNAQPLNTTIVNEFVFDWLAGRLGNGYRAKSFCGRKATQLELGS